MPNILPGLISSLLKGIDENKEVQNGYFFIKLYILFLK